MALGLWESQFQLWSVFGFKRLGSSPLITNCLVLSREWGNGLWGLLLGIIWRLLCPTKNQTVVRQTQGIGLQFLYV